MHYSCVVVATLAVLLSPTAVHCFQLQSKNHRSEIRGPWLQKKQEQQQSIITMKSRTLVMRSGTTESNNNESFVSSRRSPQDSTTCHGGSNKSTSSTSRRWMILKTVFSCASIIQITTPLAANAGIDVSALRVEGTAKPQTQLIQPAAPTTNNNNPKNIELAGISYTPAAMILQMAEQTASMEGMMRASAIEMDKDISKKDRIDAGSNGTGPGVVARTDLVKSVGVMVRNSQLASLSPAATMTLNGIPRFLLDSKETKSDMTQDEYLAVAGKYDAAREDLRRAFERMSPDEQQEGKVMIRSIRAKDEEQYQQQMRLMEAQQAFSRKK